MKLKTEILIVVVMLLMSACVAPPPQAPAAQIQADEAAAEHEHDSEGEAGLPEQMGEANLPISCTPEAQAEFDHGLAFLHSFWFGSAIDSFNQVAALDPTCAMAHWGVAMSLLGIPWSPTPEEAVAAGLEAVEKAIAAGAPTPREHAYIDAVATLYKDADTRDFRTRMLDYEAAMEQIAQDYPGDSEAQVFRALALIMTADPTDKSYANQSKASEISRADLPGPAQPSGHRPLSRPQLRLSQPCRQRLGCRPTLRGDCAGGTPRPAYARPHLHTHGLLARVD